MDFIQLEIPVFGELKRGPGSSAWKKYDGAERTFYTIRYFVNCRRRRLDQKPKMGAIYSSLGTAERVETRTLQKITFSTSQKDYRKTLHEYFCGSEELGELSGELAATIGAAPAKAKVGLSSKLSEKISSHYQATRSISREYEAQVTHEIEAEYKFDPSATKAYVVPLMYETWCYDVYLAMMDWLFVSYERGTFGITYKRRNHPSAENTSSVRQHRNWMRVGSPLCCIKYFELLHSTRIVEEDRYSNEIENPDEMAVGPAERNWSGYMPVPADYSTLYQIANRSFPDRWDAAKLEMVA